MIVKLSGVPAVTGHRATKALYQRRQVGDGLFFDQPRRVPRLVVAGKAFNGGTAMIGGAGNRAKHGFFQLAAKGIANFATKVSARAHGSTRTRSVLGPWAPSTRVCPMSAVRDGPVIHTQSPSPATSRCAKRSNAEGRSGSTWSARKTTR